MSFLLPADIKRTKTPNGNVAYTQSDLIFGLWAPNNWTFAVDDSWVLGVGPEWAMLDAMYKFGDYGLEKLQYIFPPDLVVHKTRIYYNGKRVGEVYTSHQSWTIFQKNYNITGYGDIEHMLDAMVELGLYGVTK
ncbi:MAG: hypothetical protein M0Q12_09435 [Synergistaceae bacterium]|jgi:hypothetical protein|nr:hypothetical protein [Synergistaceae bacterium]